MKHISFVVLLLTLLTPSARTWAQGDAHQDEARKAFVRGDAAFKASRFDEALSAFQQGYELSRRPRFLLNIAHTQRKLGQMREAAATYRRFLLTDPKVEDRELAQQMVDEIESLLAQEAALKPPPPPVEPVPTAPPPRVNAPAAAPPVVVAAETEASQTPLLHRWYFWAAVTAVVALGVVGAVALSSDAADGKRTGSWGELRL